MNTNRVIPTSGKAIASVALGVGGCLILGLVLGPLAILLALLAKKEIDVGRAQGSGLVIAGIILGVVAVCVHLSCLILVDMMSEPEIPTYYF